MHADYLDPAPVVVLGASNVTRSLSLIASLLAHRLGGPLEVYGAIGHGRGYSRGSRFLVWGQEPIAACGLWRALEASRQPGWALITDIGNDIAYGASPEETAVAVSRCLGRLPPRTRKLVMLPPIARLESVGASTFWIASHVLYPGRVLDRRATLAALGELTERIRILALAAGATVVTPRLQWYGVDPIHIAPGRRRRAWSEILDHCFDEGASPRRSRRPDFGAWDRVRLVGARPERWTFLGARRARQQPAVTVADGSRIWLF